MKHLLALLVWVALLGPIFAEDLTLPDGTIYKNFTITKVEPDGIRIMHSSGGAKISFEKLPIELQQKYSYDPEKAATYAKEQAALKEAAVKRAQEEKAKQTKLLQLEKEKRRVNGRIIMKVRGGLLVDCDQRDQVLYARPRADAMTRSGGFVGGSPALPAPMPKDDRPEKIWGGTVLLKGHPKHKELVDGDMVDIDAYPGGTVDQYETTSGSIAMQSLRVWTLTPTL